MVFYNLSNEQYFFFSFPKFTQRVKTKIMQTIYICRHGETQWSLSGQHTGLSDIPLTENGIAQAKALAKRVKGYPFEKVFTSPLQRAKNTADICGFTDATIDDDLCEWNYGDYEGLTTPEIRVHVPEWTIFSHGAPGGESLQDVQTRAHRMIEKIKAIKGDVAIFSSGHFSRVLGACWVGLNAKEGRLFTLSTASLCQLSYERETPVIKLWNDISHYDHLKK